MKVVHINVYCCMTVAGKMFPTHGILYTAPFTDDALYMEQYSKANFWLVGWLYLLILL